MFFNLDNINKRIAEDKFTLRVSSIFVTRAFTDCFSSFAMVVSSSQNASSRDILVLCPAMLIDRLRGMTPSRQYIKEVL